MNNSEEYFKRKIESSDSENEHATITFEESSKGFTGSLIMKQESISKIAAAQLQLKKEKIFRMPSYLSKILRRKNEIFYCVSTKEMHIDIFETTGNVYLPLITKDEINSKLNTIPREIRNKIGVLRIGAIKFLLEAEFEYGIDTPIKMALIDNGLIGVSSSI